MRIMLIMFMLTMLSCPAFAQDGKLEIYVSKYKGCNAEAVITVDGNWMAGGAPVSAVGTSVPPGDHYVCASGAESFCNGKMNNLSGSCKNVTVKAGKTSKVTLKVN